MWVRPELTTKIKISILGHYRKFPFYIYIPNVRLFAKNKLECSTDDPRASETSNETQTDATSFAPWRPDARGYKIRQKGFAKTTQVRSSVSFHTLSDQRDPAPDELRQQSGRNPLCNEFLRSTLHGF
jgi:hypothetical protein